jgi:hypothetical protein
MRTIKGYCRRQMRREVYKVVRAAHGNGNTYSQYQPKEEFTVEDFFIMLAWFICPILVIMLIRQS